MSDAFTLPRGYGFSRLTVEQLQLRTDTLGALAIWEHPRRRNQLRKGGNSTWQYIMGVDVSDGVGKDRSVISVLRVGTIEEPEEQVAEFVSDSLTPVQLAYIVDAVGHLYTDPDGFEAMAAIECNNHGLSTQDTLQLHLAFGNFYRWEYLDAADPQRRYSTKLGWVTTPRTRPMLLDKFYEALTTIDPVTHATDLIIHSPLLRAELADFQTETTLAEAEAARGAHDDCVMATAIAHYVSWRLQGGEQEPLDERRRRRHAEEDRRQAVGAAAGQPKRDWRNTGATAEEWKAQVDEDDDSVYDGSRGTPLFLP